MRTNRERVRDDADDSAYIHATRNDSEALRPANARRVKFDSVAVGPLRDEEEHVTNLSSRRVTVDISKACSQAYDSSVSVPVTPGIAPGTGRKCTSMPLETAYPTESVGRQKEA